MAIEREPVPFSRRFRHFLRTFRFPLAAVIFAAGIALTVLAIGDLTPLASSWPFTVLNTYTDQSLSNPGGTNYNLLFVVLGPIVIIIGAYLVGVYYLARRKFEHLMLTKSKAEFLRSIPDLEDLLWDLTPEDEIRYENKKAELRIRR